MSQIIEMYIVYAFQIIIAIGFGKCLDCKV